MISFVLGVSSCKKETEIALDPPEWIKGEWIDSTDNANGGGVPMFINFLDDNIKVYSQAGTYTDYNVQYEVQSQISESTGYYLRFTINTNGTKSERTFVLMPYGSMISISGGNDNVYVRP